MDVALPIRSVIPSLDGPVLAALAATSQPATLSEIARLASNAGSLSGVRNVLQRLVGVGLVDRVPGGYLLNRDHIALDAIESLASLHGELLRRIRETLDEWDGTVALAALFGSAARRDGNESSDIDLLIVSDSDGLDALADHVAERIRRWTGNDAHVITKSVDDLRRLQRSGEPIVAQWESDSMVVAGDRSLLAMSNA